MQINSTELDGAPFEFLLLSTEEDLNTGCLAVLNYVKTSLLLCFFCVSPLLNLEIDWCKAALCAAAE